MILLFNIAHVTSEFGQEVTKKKFEDIVKKCNQKCRDKDKLEIKDKENLLYDYFLPKIS